MNEAVTQQQLIVGIEASRSSLKAVLATGDGTVVDAFDVVRFDGKDALDRIAEFSISTKERFGGFSAIGIAVPGLVNKLDGGVVYSANLPEYSSLNLAEAVSNATGAEVIVENDANAAAYGEYRVGAGRASESMFYATIGDGVGGAFIIDGKIWNGVSGYAGEFGYVVIDSEGLRLQDVASTANIIRRTRERFNRDSTSSLGRLPEEQIGIDDLVSAAEEDDEFASLMLERTGSYVGAAIANVINLLDIETIVVGGEVMAAKDIVIEAIIARARELSFSRAFETTRILSGELGANASAIGAALLANRL